MKKKKLAVLLSLMCLAMGSMTVSAETKLFTFSIEKGLCDPSVWTAKKADSEQRAYITPTSIVGSGRIWAEIYDSRGVTSYTYATGIEPGEANVRKTVDYHRTGYKGATYRILACDSHDEVTSNSFQVSGRWTP